MKASIIRIGNSKGLRLSKAVLERYNIKDKVEIIFENHQIILRPIEEARVGWGAAFTEMHAKGDDSLLMDDVFEDDNLDAWD
jgi:antitoxin MazE